jgi:hypothetical protein
MGMPGGVYGLGLIVGAVRTEPLHAAVLTKPRHAWRRLWPRPYRRCCTNSCTSKATYKSTCLLVQKYKY